MIPLVKKSVDVLLAMFEVKVATGASTDVTKYNLMHAAKINIVS